MRYRTRSFAAIVAGLLLTISAAASATAAGPTAADVAAIKNFKLTTGFLHKWEAYEAIAAKHPCELSPFLVMNKTKHKKPQSLDEVAAEFDSQPGVHAALKKSGLTARELFLGMSALMGAAMEDVTQHLQTTMKTPNGAMGQQHHIPYVTKANMAFFQKHKDEFSRYQRKIGQEEYRSNHGKLPECMKNPQ